MDRRPRRAIPRRSAAHRGARYPPVQYRAAIGSSASRLRPTTEKPRSRHVRSHHTLDGHRSRCGGLRRPSRPCCRRWISSSDPVLGPCCATDRQPSPPSHSTPPPPIRTSRPRQRIVECGSCRRGGRWPRTASHDRRCRICARADEPPSGRQVHRRRLPLWSCRSLSRPGPQVVGRQLGSRRTKAGGGHALELPSLTDHALDPPQLQEPSHNCRSGHIEPFAIFLTSRSS